MAIKYAGIAMMVGILLSIVASFAVPGQYRCIPRGSDGLSCGAGGHRRCADASALDDIPVDCCDAVDFVRGVRAFSVGLASGRVRRCAAQVRDHHLYHRSGSIVIIGLGMRHFVTHMMQRAAGSEDQILLEETALAVHTTLTAVFLGFITIYPFATMLFAYGVGKLIPTMNAFKIAANALLVSGALGLITYLVAMFAPGDDPLVYLMIFNVLLLLGSIFLFVIGLGMYQR